MANVSDQRVRSQGVGVRAPFQTVGNDLAVQTTWRADALELLDAAVAGTGRRDAGRAAGARDRGRRGHGQRASPRRRGADRIGQEPRLPRARGRLRAEGRRSPPRRSRCRVSSSARTCRRCCEHGSVPFTFALLKGRSNYVCRAKLRAASKPDALFETQVVAQLLRAARTARGRSPTSRRPATAPSSTTRSPTRRGRPSAARRWSARARRTAPTATTVSPSSHASAPAASTSSWSTTPSTARTSRRTATCCPTTTS